MNEIEIHPFSPYIPDNVTTLIIGSFPGREQTQNAIDNDQWFYGAKRNQFWTIISAVYNTPLTTKEDKQKLFNKMGIGIADIFLRVRRKNESNSDKDLDVIENNNQALKLIIQNHKINTILFTSKFVEEHFTTFFPDIKNYSCLLSPSPSANIPISKSNEFVKFKKENPNGNTIDFRVFQYKQLLKV